MKSASLLASVSRRANRARGAPRAVASPHSSRREHSLLRIFATARTVVAVAFIALARLWQIGPSRLLSPTCRYEPSCSAYAIDALSRYGAWRGGWLAARRLARCHPWGGSGYDPVP